MTAINTNRTGLVIGLILGSFHFLWSILVALGWAQPVIDFIFWIHFIKPVYVIEPFIITRALILISVTAAIGYTIGASFALVWNRLHK